MSVENALIWVPDAAQILYAAQILCPTLAYLLRYIESACSLFPSALREISATHHYPCQSNERPVPVKDHVRAGHRSRGRRARPGMRGGAPKGRHGALFVSL